jgi:hypothetical protein
MSKVTEEWRRLHKEELHDLYCSPNIIRVIKLRIMKWEWHVARMGGGEMYTELWWGNLRKTGHLEDLAINGRILKCSLTLILLTWRIW